MPESRFVTANGVKLHYLEWPGSGPVVVCLHGITGQAWSWSRVGEALSPRYRVLALDQRGHGESDKPASGYDIATQVSDVAGFVQALGLPRFNLIGHSMGARVAAAYAGAYPDTLIRLVLEDPGRLTGASPAGGPSAPLEREKLRPARFATFEAAVEYMGEEKDLGSPQPRKETWTPEDTEKYARDALRQRPDGTWEWRYGKDAILQILGSRTPADDAMMEERLARITVPTLLVRGAESPVCSPENAEDIRGRIANCRMVVIPGAAHNVRQQKPAEYISAIQQFLDQS